MTTQAWSTRIRHDSDATFQEWATEFYDRVVATGMVQTSDTGQLAAPVVAARPGTNTIAGFWVFRFDDTQQGTAPIFVRFDVGTGTGATTPRVLCTVGTGTNGAGTLSGTALTTARSCAQATASATDTARQSYMCHTEGFFGFAWKVAGPEGGFFVTRTVDSAGAATATGAMVVWGGGGAGALGATQALRFAATAAAYTAQTAVALQALAHNPQGVTSSVVGSDTQAFIAYTITPQVAPLLGLCGVIEGEISAGSTFSATLVGVTAHTYIGLATNTGPAGGIGASSNGGLKLAMLWE